MSASPNSGVDRSREDRYATPGSWDPSVHHPVDDEVPVPVGEAILVAVDIRAPVLVLEAVEVLRVVGAHLDLSIRRAASVLRYLTEKGVDPKRLASQGYGETEPLDKRHNQAAYAINRRVEFNILKRKK
jgi:OmpA family protein